jgi:hypothetical protein
MGMTVCFGHSEPQVLESSEKIETVKDAFDFAIKRTSSKMIIEEDREPYVAFPFRSTGRGLSASNLGQPILLLYKHPKKPEKRTPKSNTLEEEGLPLIEWLTNRLILPNDCNTDEGGSGNAGSGVSARADSRARSRGKGVHLVGAGDVGITLRIEQIFNHICSLVQNQGFMSGSPSETVKTLEALLSFSSGVSAADESAKQAALDRCPSGLLKALEAGHHGGNGEMLARVSWRRSFNQIDTASRQHIGEKQRLIRFRR